MKGLLLLLVACAAAACDATGGAPSGGVATSFDSTGDTIVARVRGELAPSAVRHLVSDVEIAPTEDDTTLFTRISSVAVDAQGRMWVFDDPTASLFVFRPDGRLDRHIGRQGGGPGEFKSDNGMVFLPDGRLAIWDGQNARIAFVKPDGTFGTSWVHAAGFFSNNGLVTDTAGTLYVRRPVAPPGDPSTFFTLGLVRLGTDGAWVDSLVPPALGVHALSYVAERKGGRTGTTVPFSPHEVWAWHPDGYFVSGDGGQYHIHIGRKSGKPIRIERAMPPVPLADGEREDAEQTVLATMRRTDPGWTWSGPPVPNAKAPLIAVSVMSDGRIWAQVAVPSELVPEAERTPGPRGFPPRRWRTKSTYEVYSRDGRFLMRVELPSRTTLIVARGDTVWGISRSALDLPAVVRYHVTPPGS